MSDELVAARPEVQRRTKALLQQLAIDRNCTVDDLSSAVILAAEAAVSGIFKDAHAIGWSKGYRAGFTDGEKHAHEKPTIPHAERRTSGVLPSAPTKRKR